MDRLACADLVEVVTHYLDGALGAATTAAVSGHLRSCSACRNHVGQVQTATRLASALPAEQMSGDLETTLLSGYRKWAASVTV